ncbi:MULTISPECIES: ADP-dependent glucokinase/phosphofructokinase [Kaistia]|uniref:6-phosphofructokinase n=1 Tax=Kaistia nematophila TaxID=2994654 RepID=A0A9X3IP09_9HYPH|nr:ADP-dependent glucokinase/phosphofructokinase [Kaistia nematophila]MCX5572136.1 6-phosphofructokinase [Kaistia nematophila]
MVREEDGFWACEYDGLLGRLPQLIASSRLTFCGMGSCIDARIEMEDAAALLASEIPADARSFIDMLVDRAHRGVGGEIRVEWPEGPAWLTDNLPFGSSLGGTGPHAAWVLTAVGAPALVALQDRSADMVRHIPSDILVVERGQTVPVGAIKPRGEPRPKIFIFEYTAGMQLGGASPPRSSRIIVRFTDPDLENDQDFASLTATMAEQAGAGLISGFSGVARERLNGEIERVGALSRTWRSRGLGTVYLELGGFDSIDSCLATLHGLKGAYDTLGMSHSEFVALSGDGDLATSMVRLAGELELQRLIVHADHWAAAATLGDGTREREALMTGSLLASARAEAGKPVRPTALPSAAVFHQGPFDTPKRIGDWTLLSCATPYLDTPATTLGLGDSFTGGCLLILGQCPASSASAEASG